MSEYKAVWQSSTLWDRARNPLGQVTGVSNQEVITDKTISKGKTLSQIKKGIDLDSFGLWSKNIPDIKKLKVGDTIFIPHFVGRATYNDGAFVSGSVELKVKELRTITETKETISSTGAKQVSKYIRDYVSVEYHTGTKFYSLFHSSKRRRYGRYYRTEKKKTFWLNQYSLFNLYLMDGGMCPLKRNGYNCMVCDK